MVYFTYTKKNLFLIFFYKCQFGKELYVIRKVGTLDSLIRMDACRIIRY